MRLVSIAEFSVNLVGNQEEIVLFGNLAERKHVFLSVERTCRISGIADEDGLGARSDKFLELRHFRDFESVADVCRHSLQRDAVHESERVVVRVERFQHNDFVTLVASNLKRQVHALASRHCDDELRNFNVDSDFLVVLFYKSFAQLYQTCRI